MDSRRLAPRLLASWQRSERYGLSPEEMRPVFTGSVDTASLLDACGHEALRDLRGTLANEAVSMMIADSDGLVLCRIRDDASARGTGRKGRSLPPPGRVFRVYADRYEQPDGAHRPLSPGWTDALATARTALARGRVVAVVGEPGARKTALLSAARRQLGARERLLSARPPAPGEADAWLRLWTPELEKDSACVVVSGVDRLPAWAATELADATVYRKMARYGIQVPGGRRGTGS
ncbi:hypothetical protein [Streptomyces antimycoticus]|uniref:hypothetical protein n=1 Tax=Streptomyces antimycoticus TaxID=68175 RepID=UPI003825ADE1